MKITGTIVIILAMLIALTGVVMADQAISATPEVQVVSMVTTMNVMGEMNLVQGLTWQLSSNELTTAYMVPMLASGEVRYSTAYDQNIVGLSGITSLNKQMTVDSQNKVLTQSNIKAKTQANFVGFDGGNIVGSENIMIDGASRYTTASDRVLCPFATTASNIIPPYCNIFQAGSKFDLAEGAVTAQADDRFIGASIDPQVELNYNINVKGYPTTGQVGPAIGSVGSYAKAHIQASRDTTNKSEDIVFNQVASAAGYINSYTDIIGYKSGKLIV